MYRFIALSDHWAARFARRAYRGLMSFSVPAPRVIVVPVRIVAMLIRQVYFFLFRVFWCEPMFKSYCTRYGRGLRTGVFVHWLQGKGDLIIGNNVAVEGKCNFFFGVRYSDNPTIEIGDNTGIGHGCSFMCGKRITIGRNVRVGGFVQFFDVSGHSSDPARRLAGLPTEPEDVRPITIGDNTWIGTNAVIYPGVTVGENSIVSIGSVVMTNVPPNVIVAGNPARQIRALTPIGASKTVQP